MLLRAALGSTADGILVVDGRGRIILSNRRFADMWGISATELAAARDDARGIAFVLDRLADPEAFATHMKELYADAGAETFDRLQFKDGRKLESYSRPMKLAEQSFGRVWSFRDITGRLQTEESLQQKTAELDRFFNMTLDLLCIADTDGRFLRLNRAWERTLGYSEEELLATRFIDLVHPDDLKPTEAVMVGLSEQRVVIDFTNRYRCKDGTYRWIEWRSAPAGNLIYSAARDITQRKQAEEALRESERRLRSVIDAVPFGAHLYHLEADGRLVFSGANRSADLILGVEHRGFEGRTIEEAFPALRETEVPAAYRRVAANGENYSLDQIDYHEGRIRGAFEVHAVQTAPGRMAAFFRDITERKRAEEAIRKSEEFLRRVIENASGVPFSLVFGEGVGAGRYTYVGSGIEPLFEVSPERFSEAYFTSIVEEVIPRSPGVPTDPALCRQEMRRGNIPFYRADVRVKLPSGAVKWVSDTSLPIRDEKTGEVLGAMGILEDITERIDREEEVRRLNADLELRVQARTAELAAINEELESFAYSVSHDLRSPLRGIDGWSLALLEDYGDKLDPTASTYLQTVRAETQRMSQLIDALLKLSRVSRSDMKREPVDLGQVARGIEEELRRQQPERNVEFVIAPELRASGDRALLRVLLQNLLGNAWKFTAGRPQGRIEFDREIEAGVARFRVSDNGAGFDMALAGKLFTPFQRLHSQVEFPGTGIGLATVQRIVHRHGGRIWAESGINRGATFFFTLG